MDSACQAYACGSVGRPAFLQASPGLPPGAAPSTAGTLLLHLLLAQSELLFPRLLHNILVTDCIPPSPFPPFLPFPSFTCLYSPFPSHPFPFSLSPSLSLSSFPYQLHPNSIHITAVLVEYQTTSGRTNRGVTTSWLKKLQKQVNNGIVSTLFLVAYHTQRRNFM